MSAYPQSILSLNKKLQAFREVSVVMHYAIADHDGIISPNQFAFPSKTDEIDTKSVDIIRHVWLDALAHPKEDIGVIGAKPKTTEDILSEALKSPANLKIDEAFIRAAAYPVPQSYRIDLPVGPKDLRLEILNGLIPFRETRAMFMRLETELLSPIRALQIGHVAVNALEEIKASVQLSSSHTLRYN